GRQVAAGLSNGTVRLWTTERGEVVRTLSGHRYAVRAIAISADGRTLASASADQTLKLWNLQTGQLLRTIALDPTDGIPLTVLISADGQRLATATNRNTLQLWNAQTGQLLRTFVDEAVNLPPGMPIAFSPDGQKVATADVDYSVKLWNASTGARLITLKGHSQRVQHLAFSPDSQRLVSTQDQTAHLWNLQTNESIRTLNLDNSVGHPIRPNNLGYVTFSPDGKVLAASTLLLPLIESEPIPQQGLTLWDATSGQSLMQIHNVTQFQFSPNSQFLVANGRLVQVWQAYTTRVVRE
ncbi:MAG: WD40 repeat domain-containing protein, partial [Cyanobacteria bacterium Co-bin13]|nr:WD40 repeat domain-containing protein [Cyanobacteria bacterium Co-bin13]